MIQVFSHTEPGGHLKNEDAFALRLISQEPEMYLCALADGQGGRAGGALAANTACDRCREEVEGTLPTELLIPGTWVKIMRAADEAVCRESGAGFTSLVAFCLTSGLLCGASAGDSAVVLLQRDTPPRILSDEQLKDPPVGSGEATFVTFGAKVIPPWTVLAMSDGVWKYAGWETVFDTASQKRGQEVISVLRSKAALEKTGNLQDDFTIVLFETQD